MSVDLRSRVDGPTGAVDPARFFGRDLPAALDQHGATLEPVVRALAPPPLAIEIDGAAWDLVAADGRVVVHPGAVAGGLRLRLDRAQLADLAADQVTPIGWHSNGTLALAGG